MKAGGQGPPASEPMNQKGEPKLARVHHQPGYQSQPHHGHGRAIG